MIGRGEIFDVTEGRAYYGKGSGYAGFAGRDGTRAFVTGCYTPRGLTHDLRGLTPEALKAIDEWRDFYRKHDKYKRVGTVVGLTKIAPNDPMPDDCKEDKSGAAKSADAGASASSSSDSGTPPTGTAAAATV